MAETDDNNSTGVTISIQLYTLRNLPDSVPQLVQRVGGVDNNGAPGYDAVEFAGLGDADPSEVATILDQNDLSAPSAHIGFDPIENDFEATVDAYSQVGCDTFIIPYIGPSQFSSREKVNELAERLNSAAARLEEEDIRLGYHNHNHEFQMLGDQTAYDVLVEATDDRVILEVDVGWVLVAGYDPADLISRYSDRVELIHMKDMTGDNDQHAFAEIGEGDVDMREVAETARNVADVDVLVYEHDQPDNPASSASTGAGFLSLVDGSQNLECIGISDIGGENYDGDLSEST
ncbi:sugar phosphate isomerase/epimerase [Haladaptatus sp. DYF46]|uniref:sugar phosphate isomerase/epimerase family protein n=1 Tax=Haladaptatus sp. DYF46 TaxID=2886041 RepID=UPI001E354396|nr:sugar phosphate isomerase/epimerase [Haladaptatus sp. DYF46]